MSLPDPGPPHPYARNPWERLGKYLPPGLYQDILSRPEAERPAVCHEHLRNLLHTVATYLPHHVAQEHLQHPLAPWQRSNGTFKEGTLLFADISGFTALSEKLRLKREKQGAEDLIRLINAYLDIMLEILFRHQGQLIKFGGDAMLCLFSAAKQGALHAVSAAWEMKQAMALHFKGVKILQEIVPLDMKVGGNTGLLFEASVGNQDHLEYVLTGKAVERTAHAESAANPGDVLISRETCEQVGSALQVEELPDHAGFFRVVGCKSSLPASQPSTWQQVEEILQADSGNIWLLVDRLDTLTPYLPTGVLPQLVYDPTQAQVHGQHRQATILFANFIGMGEIIQTLGSENPQAITAALNEYFLAMQKEIQYYGGVVNKVDLYDTGDKLMVIFGAPLAAEREVERAALTALAMQQAVKNLSPEIAGLFTQRIGIHTGSVFAGNVGSAICQRREYTVMGDTVNLAARLMSAAPAGQIWISQQVWDPIQANFEADSLPPIQVRGFTEKVAVYALKANRTSPEGAPPQTEFKASLVGRQKELEQLGLLTEHLLSGLGKQVISITGEGGSGKTRLITEWKAAAGTGTGSAIHWLQVQGKLYGQITNGIFRDLLEHMLRFLEADSPEERWAKLEGLLQDIYQQPIPNQMAFLGQFLALDFSLHPELEHHIDALNSDNLKLQMRLAICELFSQYAQAHPLVIILDDLHWADDASLELLKFLADRIPDDLPIAFCLCYRPQKDHPIWTTWQELTRILPDCSQIALQELNATESDQLLGSLLNNPQLPKSFITQVQAATDGNPLFIYEVLNALSKDGTLKQGDQGWELTRNVQSLQVPATLVQIIQSRIDNLDFSDPGSRRVLWMAAIIGFEFLEDALLYLFTSTGRSKDELRRHLRELWNAGMVARNLARTGELGRITYHFCHDLVRQVAYDNMLVSERREFHASLGGWMETQFEAEKQRHYDELAGHYEQGGIWKKARSYHYLAGEWNARLYENASARQHLEKSLELCRLAPPSDEELGGITLALGRVLSVMGEYESALAYLHQAETALQAISTPEANIQRANVGYEIARIHERKGGLANLEIALEWQGKSLALLPASPGPEMARLRALGALVYVRKHDFDRLETEGQAALELAKAAQARSELAFTHRVLSIAARAQGKLADAMQHCVEAVNISETLGDLLGLAIALTNQGVVAWEMDDWPEAREAYLRALQIQERIGDTYQMAMTCCNLGDYYAHTGDLEDGLGYARQGLGAFQKVASPQGEIFARSVIASLLWRKGAWVEASQELQQALALVTEYSDSEFQATVRRWLAQVYLSQEDIPHAEAEIKTLLALSPEILDLETEPVQRLYGQLLARQNRLAEAQQVLQASLQRLEAEAQAYEAACTRVALAEVLTLAENIPLARTYREQARQVFRQLGAKHDIQQVEKYL